MKHIYLNKFHREHTERLKRHLAAQPKASLTDALAQYDKIKGGSSRRQHRRSSRMKHNPSHKVKVRRARAKQVMAILLNRLETLELIREEIYPAIGDFGEQLELAVVRWNGLEVYVPLDCVVFLGDQPYAKRGAEWGQKYLAASGRCAESNQRKNT